MNKIITLTEPLEVTSSMTDGSKSKKTALGTCLPDPVSEKKVEKLSSVMEVALSLGSCPSRKEI